MLLLVAIRTGGTGAPLLQRLTEAASNKDRVMDIPLTTPLLWRPNSDGKWLASFALPPSKLESVAAVLEPTNLVTDIDVFRTSASPLTASTQFKGQLCVRVAELLFVRPGHRSCPWRVGVAWVNYNTLPQVDDRYTECWAEIPSQVQ